METKSILFLSIFLLSIIIMFYFLHCLSNKQKKEREQFEKEFEEKLEKFWEYIRAGDLHIAIPLFNELERRCPREKVGFIRMVGGYLIGKYGRRVFKIFETNEETKSM